MSDIVNLYQSPETSVIPEEAPSVQGTLTETMLIYLKEASPWLRFVGVLGFIGAGFTILSGVVVFAVIPFMRQSLYSEMAGFGSLTGFMSAAFELTIGLLAIGAGVVMVFLSLFVYRFGEKIRAYLRTGTEQDLELAFRNNKSLWKFLGIMGIIHLAFIPLAIIGTVIAITFSVIFR